MRYNHKNLSNLTESDRVEHYNQMTFQVYKIKLRAVSADEFADVASTLRCTTMRTNVTYEPSAKVRW
jgi:hypothetical protein